MFPLPYRATNVTVDRVFDADTVAVAELADIVGTYLRDDYTLIVAWMRSVEARIKELEQSRG